jgi:hypothetical protein
MTEIKFESPLAYYTLKGKEYLLLFQQLQKKSTLIAFFRLVLFFGLIAGCVILGLKTSPVFLVIGILFSISAMLFIVQWHLKIQHKISFVQSLININQNEIACLHFDFSSFNDGKSAIDYQHPYTSDLDIFGENSLFQYVNRTVTPFGFHSLIDSMKNFQLDISIIEDNQKCIKELSAIPDWRQSFLAEGQQQTLDDHQVNRLFKWFNSSNQFAGKKYLKKLIVVLPVLTLVFLGWGIISDTYSLFIVGALVQIFIIMLYTKDINKIHNNVSQMHHILQSYSSLFRWIEQEKFQSKKLNDLQKLLNSEIQGASKQLKKLSVILNAFDSRLNILVAIPLNTLFLFDLHSVFRLESWKDKNLKNNQLWFETLGEFDKLISLANYSFNNPEYCFPIVKNENYKIKATELGHPLIPIENRVTNHFESLHRGTSTILTGANMAGKSTFLRTIGVNLVLGMTGSPVCAATFEFGPTQIHTSINVRDSLKGNESYFYAELQRLKSIIAKLLKNEPLFIILDEILKGTNSNDKLKGSISLLTRLKDMNVSGIIATHDISLSELENQFPENFKNFCFEVSLDNDFLFYDYKLVQGVCKNLNALLLMKKMGIVN